jgi:alpha-ketoglutarate-dependent taurine dioxygenase
MPAAPEIRRLDAPFGAEVVGVELRGGVEREVWRALAAALHSHRLLLFRGEPRADADLVAFARRFGELVTLYAHETTVPGFREIVRVSNLEEAGRPIGLAGSQELPWHHDHSYLDRPAKESFLEAVEVPERGPETSFTDMAAALRALPASLRARLAGLRCVHHVDEREVAEELGGNGGADEAGRFAARRVRSVYGDATNALAQDRIAAERAVHPLVARHPDSGTPVLYASPLATHEVVGMDARESAELLAELFERALRPEHITTHAWSRGDLVVFDTISTLHRRDAFDPGGRRYMKQLSTRCADRLDPASAADLAR